VSRGHGKIQQHILEAIGDGGVYPLIYMAKNCGYDIAAPACANHSQGTHKDSPTKDSSRSRA
jgi:hypothetical protein